MDRKEIEKILIDVIADQLNIAQSTVILNAKLVGDLGVTSLELVELAMRIEEKFTIEITEENCEEIKTVNDAVNYIDTQLNPPATAVASNGWQRYVDDALIGTHDLSQAAILGLDGSPWAQSQNFNINTSEAQQLLSLFENSTTAFAAGITINGVKYVTTKSDNRSIYGKKNTGGCICVKTGQALILGIYPEGGSPGAAVSTCEKLADFLIEQGY